MYLIRYALCMDVDVDAVSTESSTDKIFDDRQQAANKMESSLRFKSSTRVCVCVCEQIRRRAKSRGKKNKRKQENQAHT